MILQVRVSAALSAVVAFASAWPLAFRAPAFFDAIQMGLVVILLTNMWLFFLRVSSGECGGNGFVAEQCVA